MFGIFSIFDALSRSDHDGGTIAVGSADVHSGD